MKLPWAMCVALALCACDRKPKTVEERGAGVFARACAGCHGMDGRGTRRPGFKTPPRDLTSAPVAAMTDEHIVDVIRHGKGQMPAFGKMLPAEDVEAVVRYVRTLRPRGKPSSE